MRTMLKLNLVSSLILLAGNADALSINSSLPIYPAGIVGRNLALWGFGWAGHVGITTAEDISQISTQVIEVMNDTPVIQINSIDDFKSRTVYWGARYGIADQEEGGAKILHEANYQRGFCPIYTATAAFVPGTGFDEEGKPTHCAVFRCDTFINYVFHTAGYDLPTYNSFTLPVKLFSAFPKGYGDGPLAMAAKNFPSSPNSKSITQISTGELDQMDFEEFMTLIDLPSQQLSKEAINKTWSFALDPHLSIEKRIYLVDYLGLKGNVELIPQMIDLYPKVDNEELKSMLLRSTFTLHQQFSWLKNNPKEKERLQGFYADLLTKKLSEKDAVLVLRGFINLSSETQILAKKEKLETSIKDLNPQMSVGLWLELLMKSKELEEESLPEILSLLNRESNSDLDDLFNQFVARRLGKLGVNSLRPESKNQIANYLNSIAYRYNQPSPSLHLNRPYYGAWLEAKVLVESDSLDEAARSLAKQIQDKPFKEQEKFISGVANNKLKLYLRKQK